MYRMLVRHTVFLRSSDSIDRPYARLILFEGTRPLSQRQSGEKIL
jgi:hypothetical protein